MLPGRHCDHHQRGQRHGLRPTAGRGWRQRRSDGDRAEIATAVELKGWTAVGGADAVTLGWTTLRENDVVEFRLYRSIGADLAGATLVARIPAQGSADGGYEKAYSYVDGGLSAGTYNYWLVEANDSGSEKAVAGPTAAVVGVDDQAHQPQGVRALAHALALTARCLT